MTAFNYRPRLLVMAKEPRLGRVKTRLAKSIGPVSAWACYRQLMTQTFQRLSGPESWDRIALVTPDGAALARPFWPKGWRPLGQGSGDLGIRMARPMKELPPGPVVLVGSDIPGICKADIKAAFKTLQNKDMVFGPATDGGFWLVGMARRTPPPRHLFKDITWSSDTTLEQCLNQLSGQTIGFGRTQCDLDA